ncbi:MAG: hypothetical protein QXE86_01885 [Archaeoglobaceae archaeon]
MRASYEIKVRGEAMKILVEALNRAKVAAEEKNGSVLCFVGCKKKTIEFRDDSIVVEGVEIKTFANYIAKKTQSSSEVASLGALAWLGIVGIEYLITAAYCRDYKHAIAAKRCYELLKARKMPRVIKN